MASATKQRLEKLFDDGLDWDKYYAREDIVDEFAAELESLERRAEAWDALDAHTQLVNSGAEDTTEARKRLNRAIDKVRNNG